MSAPERNPMDVRTPYCVDCGHGAVAVYWGGGGRCQKCSDKFGAEIHRKKLAEAEAMRAHVASLGDCEGCGEREYNDRGECQECCEHEFDPSEGGMCINCDKEYPH